MNHDCNLVLALAVCYRDACEKSKQGNGEEERAWRDRGQVQPGDGRRHEHPPRTSRPGRSPGLPGGSAMAQHLCCSHAFSVFPSPLSSTLGSAVERKRHPVLTLNVTNGNRRGSLIDHLPLSGSRCRVPAPCGTAGFPLHLHPRGCFSLELCKGLAGICFLHTLASLFPGALPICSIRAAGKLADRESLPQG